MTVITVFDQCPVCGKELGEFQVKKAELEEVMKSDSDNVEYDNGGWIDRKVICQTCSDTMTAAKEPQTSD